MQARELHSELVQRFDRIESRLSQSGLARASSPSAEVVGAVVGAVIAAIAVFVLTELARRYADPEAEVTAP